MDGPGAQKVTLARLNFGNIRLRPAFVAPTVLEIGLSTHRRCALIFGYITQHHRGPSMKSQKNGSRRHFLSTIATAAGTAIMLRPRLGWAADAIDPRVADIVAKTIGIDTHNHIDVPLTAAEMPGPDIDLAGEMKRSGLSAICMTFATDYQPGDAYDRFLKGLASMDRQSQGNS